MTLNEYYGKIFFIIFIERQNPSVDKIYLDNSATTAPSQRAIEACVEAMQTGYGNPSSVHECGTYAAKLLNDARNEILCAICGEKLRSSLPRTPALISPIPQPYGRLIFTGSGTEANNTAIFGVTDRYRSNPSACKIISTDSEHPSVTEPLEKLRSEGYRVAYISTKNGVLDFEQLKNELTPDVKLVTFMLANNETGAVYKVKEAFELVRSKCPEALCHTDAVQAFQKIPFTAASLGADMISVSGHKVHAPKGVGALWVSGAIVKRNKLAAYLLGGGQENGLRSGTENIPGIAAFAAAVKENGGNNAGRGFSSSCAALRRLLLENLPDGVRVNVPEGEFLSNIVSITLPIPRSQPMLNYLSARGIFISAGSACSSHKNTVSGTLLAFGLTEAEAHSTVRVSLDVTNTEQEILSFCRVLGEGVTALYGKKK